jgi:predicted RNase H-like nuclease (RuvC/YqgF family)
MDTPDRERLLKREIEKLERQINKLAKETLEAKEKLDKIHKHWYHLNELVDQQDRAGKGIEIVGRMLDDLLAD